MTHKYSEYYIYTISSPLTLPCPSLPLNVMTYLLIYHMCMSLGPGYLSGDSSQEKTLKSQWLPEALHLGLGPCEISHPCGHAQVVILPGWPCAGNYSVEISQVQLLVMSGRDIPWSRQPGSKNLSTPFFPDAPWTLRCRGCPGNAASWSRNTVTT